MKVTRYCKNRSNSALLSNEAENSNRFILNVINANRLHCQITISFVFYMSTSGKGESLQDRHLLMNDTGNAV